MSNQTEKWDWRPVSAADPCPLCEKCDWCSVTADGRFACCMRRKGGSIKPCKNGGWLHKLVPDDPPAGHKKSGGKKAGRKKAAPPSEGWQALAERYAKALSPELRRQIAADWLGLPPNALDRFPLVGVREDDPLGVCTTWPETDAAGTVVGINRRWKAGTGPTIKGVRCDKATIAGSARGLTIPAGLELPPSKPLLVVEGPTCCAAVTAAGLPCVGRFSVSGGAEMVAGFVRLRQFAGRVIVVGENDRKDDGRWPGRDDAKRFAGHLADMLGRPVLFALPPAGAKDARDYLAHSGQGRTS